MAKPEWGTKRLCNGCGNRYYDMGVAAPNCPSCGIPSADGGFARRTLRAATAEAHAALEAVPINRRLFAEDFAPAELANLLGRMMSVYRPLEARLAASPPEGWRDYRRRLPLLMEGIAFLGGCTVFAEVDIPALADEPSRWGALYVIEGSTLGGRMIHRQLVARHPPEALSFFVPHGDLAGERWRHFLAGMETALTRPNALEGAVMSAIDTFRLFRDALAA